MNIDKRINSYNIKKKLITKNSFIIILTEKATTLVLAQANETIQFIALRVARFRL